MNYQDEAMQTLSEEWHADKVDRNEFADAVASLVLAAERVDAFKKALYYGDSSNLPAREVRRAMPAADDCTRRMRVLLHAIIGAATEAGELCENVLDMLNGEVDETNAVEEFGDLLWYTAIGADALGVRLSNFQSANIAKLRKRYPGKFTAYDAKNRNLDAERKILEERS